MQTNWFYTVWPFIGLGGTIVMVAILLMTDTFRGNTTVSRWRDSGWLAVPLYWVHQFEEYSLPVLGFDYSIQEMICKNLGFPPYPDCPIPPVVNIALMWFGAPLAAYLGLRKRPHRPQLLGIALSQRTSAHRGGRRAGRLQHRPMERGHLVCSVVRLGHLRLRDPRAVQRQGRGRGVRRRSPHSCLAFPRLRAFQVRRDRQCGPASETPPVF
jgi:hypothetical protein